MTAKDQAIAPTSADYAMGYAEGFNDACKPLAQPATPEDMVIYKAIADNYQNSLKPPAPDCRTCTDYDRLEGCLRAPRYGVCANGDKYQPAPQVVLWRTPTDFAARRDELREEYKSGFDSHPDKGLDNAN